MHLLPSGKAAVCLTVKAGSSPVRCANQWTLGGRVTGTIESGCHGNFQLESKSDRTQIDWFSGCQSKGLGNK